MSNKIDTALFYGFLFYDFLHKKYRKKKWDLEFISKICILMCKLLQNACVVCNLNKLRINVVNGALEGVLTTCLNVALIGN